MLVKRFFSPFPHSRPYAAAWLRKLAPSQVVGFRPRQVTQFQNSHMIQLCTLWAFDKTVLMLSEDKIQAGKQQPSERYCVCLQ